MFTIQKYGRKNVLIVGMVIMGLCLLAFSVFLSIKEDQKVLSVVGLIVSVSLYNISLLLTLGPIMWVYLP